MRKPTHWPKFALCAQVLAIAAAGAWAYAPALRGGWVWDDLTEVAHNPVLPDARGIGKIWFSPADPDYFPLKTTAQWLEWRLWQDHPLGYHAVNVGLHILSALLFWRLLRKVIGPADPCRADRLAAPKLGEGGWSAGAWLGGMLFVLHPLAVESVAWIAELKNALSLPPLLLAFSAYVDWDGMFRRQTLTRSATGALSPVAETVRFWPSLRNAGAFRYGLSLFLFLLALLCKTSVVMFPGVLLLYAWWRRGSVRRADWLAALPFAALSLAFGLITLWFQYHRAIVGAALGLGGLGSRAAVAGLSSMFYLGKVVLPVRLAPIYPRWAAAPPTPVEFLPWAAWAAIAFWLWAAPSARGVRFGLGVFWVMLLPVLGFIPMAYLRISWAADHLAYVPMLGLIGAAAAGLAAKGGRALPLPVAVPGVILFLVFLGVETRRQAAIYRSDEVFWRTALKLNPDAWLAHSDLALSLAISGRRDEAIAQYREALRLRADYPEAHDGLANALAGEGRLREAEAEYEEALRLEPHYLDARYGLANTLGNEGRLGEAIAQYEEALRLKPDYVEARANLGLALAGMNRGGEAVAQLRRALELRPDYPEAHAYLGFALAGLGRYDDAIAEYRAALRFGAGSADLHYNLGAALRAAGRMSEAREEFEMAARMQAGPPGEPKN